MNTTPSVREYDGVCSYRKIINNAKVFYSSYKLPIIALKNDSLSMCVLTIVYLSVVIVNDPWLLKGYSKVSAQNGSYQDSRFLNETGAQELT